LRTDGSFSILLSSFRTCWGVGVLNSAIFNSFHNRVEFGTILEFRRGGGCTPLGTPLSVSSDWTTGWTACGSKPEKGKRFTSSPKSSDWLWGPDSQLLNGCPECEVEHSPPSRMRLRMNGVIPLLSLYPFMEGIEKTLSFFNSPN